MAQMGGAGEKTLSQLGEHHRFPAVQFQILFHCPGKPGSRGGGFRQQVPSLPDMAPVEEQQQAFDLTGHPLLPQGSVPLIFFQQIGENFSGNLFFTSQMGDPRSAQQDAQQPPVSQLLRQMIGGEQQVIPFIGLDGRLYVVQFQIAENHQIPGHGVKILPAYPDMTASLSDKQKLISVVMVMGFRVKTQGMGDPQHAAALFHSVPSLLMIADFTYFPAVAHEISVWIYYMIFVDAFPAVSSVFSTKYRVRRSIAGVFRVSLFSKVKTVEIFGT